MSIWVWIANIGLWPLIHLTVSYSFTRMKAESFDPYSILFKTRRWEMNGSFYQKFFFIKSWKSKLPDGAAWFAGAFPKKKLSSRSPEYLKRFLLETCRAEAAHWATFFCFPIFFIWNPPWACAVMFGYAVFMNLPCIVVQRYNRIVLKKINRGASGRD